jgi:DNA mismatch repair protein MSH3
MSPSSKYAASQPTISAFFASSPSKTSSVSAKGTKRAASPIDLTLEEEENALPVPVTKKPKASTTTTTSHFFARGSSSTQPLPTRPSPFAPPHSSPSTTNTAQQWRFVPSPLPATPQGPHNSQPSGPSDLEKSARHEAFKKTLLGPKDPFARRKALADAQSVEELTQLEAEIGVGVPSDAEDGDEGAGDEENGGKDTEKTKGKAAKGKGKATTKSTSKAKATPAQDEADHHEATDSDPGFAILLAGFAAAGSAKSSKSKSGTARKKKEKAPVELGPSGEPWTPLELQILELKKANPGTVLMIEVGYKYRFYEEDARIAAKELGFVAFPAKNLLAASMPVQRRDVHLKKSVSFFFIDFSRADSPSVE